MDSLETSSNWSDHSDQAESIVSNLSGLSGYEDELLEIRSLIRNTPKVFIKESASNSSKSLDVYHYETKIKNLNADLENALKLNEKLKNEILDRQCRYELDYHNKFEKLLSVNNKLQLQLNLANEHIKRSQKCQSLQISHDLQEKVKNLEKSNFELTSEINLLQNDVDHWKNSSNDYEDNCRKQKIELEEIKYKLDSKSNAIAALKRTIADLHLQNQNVLQDSVTVNNVLMVKQNEVDALKNSELWYREQLYLCQQEKNKLFDENVSLSSELASKTCTIDNIHLELASYKNRNQELVLRFNKEKQDLINKLEALQNTNNNGDSYDLEQNHLTIVGHYEDVIKDLKLEIDSVKQEIVIQRTHFESIKKQNSDLTSLNAIIQKKLNEKEGSIENLQFQIKNLEINAEFFRKQVDVKDKTVADLTEKNIEYQTALNLLSLEKAETEAMIVSVREDFNKLLNRFNSIKLELHEKEQLISKMQNENHKMHINNNRQTSEIKKLQMDSRKLHQLKEIIDKFKIEKQIIEQEKKDQSNIIESLKKVIEKLEREQRISAENNRNIIDENRKEINNYNKRIEELIDENRKEINNYNKRIKELEGEKETLSSEMQYLKEKLRQLDAEKENLLLEKSNFSKYALELKNNIKELNDAKETLNDNTQFLQKENKKLYEEYQKDKDHYESEIKNLHANIQSLNSKILSLGSSLEMKENEILPLKNALVEMQTQNRKITENNCLITKHSENNNESKNLESCSSTMNNILSNVTSLLQSITNNEPMNSKITCMEFLESYKPLKTVVDTIMAIENYKQNLTSENRKYKHFIANIKEKLSINTKEMEEQHKKIFEKQNETERKFVLLSNAVRNYILMESSTINKKTSQDVENLTTLLKAKEMELKEKQKKYELNNRTLLKKVKEHMRGRRLAEKRCSYLEDLYNSVFEEFNTLKLKYSSNEYQIQNLESICENYKVTITKLKQKVMELQMRVNEDVKPCDKCFKLNELISKEQNYLESIRTLMEEKEKQLELYNNLELEFQKLSHTNGKLEKDYDNLKVKYENTHADVLQRDKTIELLEDSISSLKNMSSELNERSLKQQNELTTAQKEIENMTYKLQHKEEENKLLSDKITMLSCKLNQLEEELSSLQTQKQVSDTSWNKRELELQNLNNLLQQEITSLRNDINALSNERSFFQKVCSNLKIALDAVMHQNKIMKDKLTELSKNEKSGNLCDLMLNLPTSNKWNENQISELLRRNNTSVQNPFSELHSSLVSLRDDVIGLRKQISEKNSLESP